MPSIARRSAGRVVDIALNFFFAYITVRTVPADRPIARLLLCLAAMAAYEALFLLQLGATPGKFAAGTKVLPLGQAKIETRDAWLRGIVSAAGSLALMVSGPSLWAMGNSVPALIMSTIALSVAIVYISSVFSSPTRRGTADLIANTTVVSADHEGLLSQADVESKHILDREPILTVFGSVPTTRERRIARAHRLDTSPGLIVVLVVVLVLAAIDLTLFSLFGSALWAVLLMWDEARAVARDGGTFAHRSHGLKVVDARTGAIPSFRASLVRSVALTVCWLIPPFLLLAWAMLRLNPLARGLHDQLSGTMVVKVEP